jgi:hypothetical protein
MSEFSEQTRFRNWSRINGVLDEANFWQHPINRWAFQAWCAAKAEGAAQILAESKKTYGVVLAEHAEATGWLEPKQ